MAEFDDKLNSLLSNPEAMDQIMKMAQSLMGGEGQTGSSTPPPNGPPPQQPYQAVPQQAQQPSPGQNTTSGAWSAPRSGGPPPSENFFGAAPGQNSGQGGGTGGWGAPPNAAPPPGGPDLSFLSGLGSIDPKTIASLLPILRELGGDRDSNARRLLFALRPYLKPERQEKVERALQLARLFRVGKKFLLKGEDHV